MIYLGIAGTVFGEWGHDPAACLLEDGKIVAVAEEERFVRFKHAFTLFPINAMKFCLDYAGIKLKDVDKIGYYANPNAFRLFNPNRLKRTLYVMRIRNRFKKIYSLLHFHFGYRPEKVHFIEHHVCHTYSSFPLSGFKKPTCISIDATGEENSCLISRNGEILRKIPSTNSLGWMYLKATEWLGFKGNNGEGKTMGLAAYSRRVLDWSDLISFCDGGEYKIKEDVYNYLVRRYGDRRRGEIQQIHKDVASTVQQYLENAVTNMVSYYTPGQLCLAGGVSLNCKMNGILLEDGLVNDIFIQPMATDAGCSLGSAVYLSMEDGNKFNEMTHVYYGPEYTDREIMKVLNNSRAEYEYHKDMPGIVSELLAEGKIVGWFQGRMECGPRALGNRSILADPRDRDMKNKINRFVKHRESWRPYCPSILKKYMSKYFEIDHPSPFMILAFRVRKEKLDEIPAVVHVDGTARPQTVTEDQNPMYYRLINNFRKETGVPLVLNTSLNIRGQPIVCSPKDALSMFFTEGLDAVAIGNYLLKK